MMGSIATVIGIIGYFEVPPCAPCSRMLVTAGYICRVVYSGGQVPEDPETVEDLMKLLNVGSQFFFIGLLSSIKFRGVACRHLEPLILKRNLAVVEHGTDRTCAVFIIACCCDLGTRKDARL